MGAVIRTTGGAAALVATCANARRPASAATLLISLSGAMRRLRFGLLGVLAVLAAGVAGSANEIANADNSFPHARFTPPTVYGTGAYPTTVAAGDLNGDGKPDVVVATGNGFEVLMNKTSSGSFATSLTKPASFGTGLVGSSTLVDLNGDGRLDVAITQPLGNEIAVFTNS